MRKVMLFSMVVAVLAFGASQAVAGCGGCEGDSKGEAAHSHDGKEECCGKGGECCKAAEASDENTEASTCCGGKPAEGKTCCAEAEKAAEAAPEEAAEAAPVTP
ncbi:MAG: hypothetical protein O3B24_11190 [Verrucomicrobia bacterium]|nr:hypothetical protein [Verrucomicrobiota bacterium]